MLPAYLSQSGISAIGDQSANVAQWLYDNRGRLIVFDAPAQGQMFQFGGIVLDSNYDGMRIRWDGFTQLPPNADIAPQFGGCWVGVVIGQADSVTLENVMIDANRANMTANEHIVAIGIAGATNPVIAHGWRVREMRGDAIYVAQADWQTSSANPQNVTIGDGCAYNSTDDGRNAISIISCSGGTIGKLYSYQVGGVVGGAIEPGGLDIEPDYGYQSVSDLTVDAAIVTTAGTCGVAVYGKSISGDVSARDWNCNGITFKTVRLKRTGTSGGAIAANPFIMCGNVKVLDGEINYATTPGAGAQHDFADNCEAHWKVSNVTYGAWLGQSDKLVDSCITVQAKKYSIAAVRSTCTQRVNVRVKAYGAIAGSTAFPVQCLAASRAGGVTQSNTHYYVDAPYDGVNARAFRNEPGDLVSFGAGTEVRYGDWTGYVNAPTTIDAAIPKRNITGLMQGANYPQIGTWAAGDIFEIVPPQYNLTTGKVLSRAVRITNGAGQTNGVDWVNDYGTNT